VKGVGGAVAVVEQTLPRVSPRAPLIRRPRSAITVRGEARKRPQRFATAGSFTSTTCRFCQLSKRSVLLPVNYGQCR
jgi:hypothetical protein